MTTLAHGRDRNGEAVVSSWSLIAHDLEGPHVPTLAVSATLRQLLDGRLEPDARPCVGFLALDEVMADAESLPIFTRTDGRFPDELGLFRRLMGPAFDSLPAGVRRVHSGRTTEVFRGRAIVRGSGGLAVVARSIAGIRLGRFGDFSVEIAPIGSAEVWTRRFGRARFRSLLRDVPHELSRFTERLGPFTFVLEARPAPSGFRWRPAGWRMGPIPLPSVLAPRIRAFTFEREGQYRFSVLVAHPWMGLIAGYAGRLTI
jgi:hypothetical protein